MKKRLVLATLCALTLGSVAFASTSCANNVVTTVKVENVTISNKTELLEEFKVGDENRRLNLVATPDGANLSEAINNGEVYLSSSDTKIAYVTGSYVIPVSEGKATISVNVKSTDSEGKEVVKVTDSVDITLLPKPEPIPAKTEHGIVSVSQVLEKENNKETSYIVKGKISRWTKSTQTDGTAYGNFYLQDLTDTTKEIQVYGASASTSALSYDDEKGVYSFTNPKDFLTNTVTKDTKIGDVIYMQAIRADYKTTIEITGIIFDSVNNVMNYENAATTAYNVVGKVSNWKGTSTDGTKYGNLYLQDLTDSSKEILVYGATATASALAYDSKTKAYVFTNPKDFITDEFTKTIKLGDILTMKVIRADYGSTIEIVGVCFATTAA